MIDILEVFVNSGNVDHVASKFIELPVCHCLWRVCILECRDLEALTWVESEILALQHRIVLLRQRCNQESQNEPTHKIVDVNGVLCAAIERRAVMYKQRRRI